MSEEDTAQDSSGKLTEFVGAPLTGISLGLPYGSFVIGEWTDSGDESSATFPIAPLHVHRDDDEAWYVLEGTLHFRLGDDVVSANAGTAIYGLHGIAHTYWNESGEPARYLIVMTADTAAMIEALHEMESRDVDDVRALFHRFGCVLV